MSEVAERPRVWFELARAVRDVNAANGWEAPSWPTLPVKIMLVVTELNEARTDAQAPEADPVVAVGEELADVAIRLLDILQALWPNAWTVRTPVQVSPLGELERLLWPCVEWGCMAVEHWRDDDKGDAMVSLEFALAYTRGLAQALELDLYASAAAKNERNAGRGLLHGRSRADG